MVTLGSAFRAGGVRGVALACAVTIALAGCGGGGGRDTPDGSEEPTALHDGGPVRSAVLPHFHLAPVLLDEPAEVDVDGSEASVHTVAHTQAVFKRLESLSSKRLSYEVLRGAVEQTMAREGATPAGSATAVVTTYTPAQIRAAYQFPALTGLSSAAGATLAAASAAPFGSGQTIYVIDAYHDANVLSDLATFDTRFGLPACTSLTIPVTATLPLAAAKSGSACQLAVVYASPAGKMTSTVPAYNAGWQPETAIDTQWVHATAPLARIVLIEAQDSSGASLLGALQLANTMGPGVVSMSFGSAEGPYVPSYDSWFSGPSTLYVASTGDSGEGIQWPAVSPHVLGVGGTSVTVTTSNTRTEVAWPGSSGGLSTTEPLPSWQPAVLIASSGTTKAAPSSHRELPDVAFNANPYTGQYVYVTAPGAPMGSWLSAGGTSLAAPQWAGVLSIANAQRALAGKTPLAAAQPDLYRDIYAVKGNYATDMLDVTSGSNGSCASCNAGSGYDLVTGLGTPNVTASLAILTQY